MMAAADSAFLAALLLYDELGCSSIDNLGMSPNLSLIIFRVKRHVHV